MKRLVAIGALFLALLFTGCQPAPASVTLALLGDVMLGRGVDAGTYSLAYLSADLASADLALANLESPFAPSLPLADSSYNLCASSSRANLLAGWGIDLVSIANNHRFNCGPDGLASTVASLETVGITPIGPGVEPVMREINGLKLVFLALDDVSSPVDASAATQVIRSARHSGALVVVSIHWGMEYQGGASVRQKYLAHQFVDAGASLVWGHHPHVLQPCEGCSLPDGPQPVIFYSLGNALFDQAGLDDTRQSVLAIVTLASRGVTNIRLVPFVIDIRGSRVNQPDLVSGGMILNRLGLP
jgi:poly-gamma-glutamate synthesis protein (capsule biosynthesis protein)